MYRLLLFSIYLFLSSLDISAMNQEKDHRITALVPFIAFQRGSYESWTRLPLAEHFKNKKEWSSSIVSDLFSEELETQLRAKQACQALLNEIILSQKSLKETKKKASCLRCCNIFAPITMLAAQLYFGCYGPGESISTTLVTYKCTDNLSKLDKTSQAHLRHAQQLALIANEIETIVRHSQDNEGRKKILHQSVLGQISVTKQKLTLLKALQEQEKELEQTLEDLERQEKTLRQKKED